MFETACEQVVFYIGNIDPDQELIGIQKINAIKHKILILLRKGGICILHIIKDIMK